MRRERTCCPKTKGMAAPLCQGTAGCVKVGRSSGWGKRVSSFWSQLFCYRADGLIAEVPERDERREKRGESRGPQSKTGRSGQ